MSAKHVLTAAVIAIGVTLAGPAAARAQTNVIAESTTVSRLSKPSNWGAFPGGGEYYKFSAANALPSQTQQSWTVGATTVRDLTRVGDGQCVDFVKTVSGVGVATTQWIKGLDVVDANGRIITVSAGTAIATFVNGKYQAGHAMAVLEPHRASRSGCIEFPRHSRTFSAER